MATKPPNLDVADKAEDEDDHYDEKAFIMYNYQPKSPTGTTGRSSFIPQIESPGPAAYSPNASSIKQAQPKAVFGTSKRENEAHRFISDLHNKALPPTDSPGPGTYRIQKADTYPHSPTNNSTPSWGFGTAPQRTDERGSEAALVPGPIYDQTPINNSLSYTFAPQGNFELGQTRSRNDTSKVFISSAHSAIDPSTSPFQRVGPGNYDPKPELLSSKRKEPCVVFSKSSRDIKDSLSAMQCTAEPLATSAGHTPGAIYEYKGQLDARATSFGTGPRTYSPEKGNSTAGPYLSRLHEVAMQGTESPGAGTYTVVGGRNKAVAGLGDGPTFKFGSSGSDRSFPLGMAVPGPGAYNPKQDTLSRTASAPAFSISSNIRTDFVTPASKLSPGPAAYDVVHASMLDARKSMPAAYSMGAVPKIGRASFVQSSVGPGPAAYVLPTSIQPEAVHKGFSFGIKERTKHEKSTVSVRYHGPLASLEALGTQSPGPGLYDTRDVKVSNSKEPPNVKFGTAEKTVAGKVYISRMHAEAEGTGLDSPGPCAYNHHAVELSKVTSKYPKGASAAFSTSSRFKMNYLTF